MNYRDVVLISDEVATTPTTRMIPLSVTDLISAIDIEYKATAGGSALADHPAANISKVQVVDGSDVLTSLSGKECQGLQFWNTGNPAYNEVVDVGTIMSIATLRLNFGRYLWDPSLGLDCSKFKNPQLLITHNYQTSDTGATAAVMSVTEHAFDAKTPTFVGFLTAKEIFNYTCGAAASMQQVQIPRDRVIRQIMLQGVGHGYAPWQIYNQLKLSENNDAKVPFNTYTTKLMKGVFSKYGRLSEAGLFNASVAARAAYFQPYMDISVEAMQTASTDIMAMPTIPTYEPLSFTAGAAHVAQIQVSGHSPHGTFPLQFGDLNNLDDWYDVTGLGQLNLNIIAGSAGVAGSVNVVTEQLRKY